MTCSNCGTIVSGNVLEQNRIMKCPGLGCETELRYEELTEADRRYIRSNRAKFRVDG